jgi:DNA-directed RNA polymerase subunit RPC12/RpoP
VIASGARDIAADAAAMMTFKCSGCGAEVTVNTANAMTARCHWCRHVLGVNEQIPNGAVPDAVLPFHIKKDDAIARIRQFVDKRRLFALKEFKEQFTPENVVGVYLPYMIVDANVGADVAGKGEVKTREYTKGSGDDKKTYYDADVYQVQRHVDFTVDDLPLESSVERGNLDTRVNTNNIINTILPFDTKNAVKWNASYLSGFTSEKRDRNVEALRPHLEDQLLSIARAQVEGIGEPLRPRRALGAGSARRARHALGVDVPAGLAVFVPPTRQQRRHAALHRGQRPHRRDDGQRARAAVEAARHRAHRRHLPRRHRTLDRGAFVMSDDGGLWLLLAGPAGATGLYWALYRYYRNTDKSHDFEHETKVDAKPVTGSNQKVDEIVGTRETRIRGDNVREYRTRVQRLRSDSS